MKKWPLASISLALTALIPTVHAETTAQPPSEWRQELDTLRQRLAELEARLKQSETAASAQSAGMTVEQQQQVNRLEARADAADERSETMGIKGLTLSGYMDPTFIYNQRAHRAGFQFLNDGAYAYDNSFMGSMLLDITKTTENGTVWKLGLTPQRSTQGVAEGISSIVQEANVTLPIPGSNTTKILAGLVPDWAGYEAVDPVKNKLVTHNLLFDFSAATEYVGAGLVWASGDWEAKGMLANINASRRDDGEKAPGLAFRLDYVGQEYWGGGLSGLLGKAYNGQMDADSRVNLLTLDGWYERGDLSLAGQLTYGNQKKAAITRGDDGELRDAAWYGASATAAYKFRPRLTGIVRADYVVNRKNGGGLLGGYTETDSVNGIGPGMVYRDGEWVVGNASKGVNRAAFTVGLNYAYNENTAFKLEYRLDHANGNVFLDSASGAYKRTNQLIGTSVVVSF
ncbi:MAG: DUF3138 family protein [Comamonas sp.]